MNLLSRGQFRQRCVKRDNQTCVVPACTRTVTADPESSGEVHHIIERSLWDNGGWYVDNGASVCTPHHRLAENNKLPPQAFWSWLDIINPPTPNGMGVNINKWGKAFATPPWSDERKYIKYPSTRHLPFSPQYGEHEADCDDLSSFLNLPLVVTRKMDGSNIQLTADHVAARNGSHARHPSFDYLKQRHAQFKHKIPPHLQLFGEWLYAKHSIHYGCDCSPSCDDQAEPIRDELQLFGVFDTRFNLWLGWKQVQNWANKIGCVTTPILKRRFRPEAPRTMYKLNDIAQKQVKAGHEGIIVRSAYPFHYGQFSQFLAKYVREDHVDPEAEHWSKQKTVRNNVKG